MTRGGRARAAPYFVPGPAEVEADDQCILGTSFRSTSRLAPGLELAGEYDGAGSIEPQYLLRRGNGSMLLVSPMLYQVASEIDGSRDLEQIATRVTSKLSRGLSPEDVGYLIDHKLRPLGVLAGGAPQPSEKSRPLLALTARSAVMPSRLVISAAKALGPLFLPPVIGAALLATAAVDARLIAGGRFRVNAPQILERPTILLVVLALTLAAGAFHELGHATASYYGGAPPGAIGIGIYLLWPAFYSDLTESYRLGRSGRLRADLGGVYFNLLIVLVLAGLYALTGLRALVLAIIVQHLVVAQQFLPFLRLDGYYVMSDLTGVPDLFGRTRPVLAGLFRRDAVTVEVAKLRPKVQAMVTTWVLATVLALTAGVALMLVHLPSYLSTAARMAVGQSVLLAHSFRDQRVTAGLLATLRLVFVAVQPIGLGLITARVIRNLHRRGRAQISTNP
jgi:putative peptide zinc metalloprotease protein